MDGPHKVKLQRATSGANSKSHTEPLFKFYNILKVDDIFTYKLLTFYWKAKQAQLPKYLSKFLPELSEGANKYAIRHPRLQPPVHKHEYIKGTCRYQLAMPYKIIENSMFLRFVMTWIAG